MGNNLLRFYPTDCPLRLIAFFLSYLNRDETTNPHPLGYVQCIHESINESTFHLYFRYRLTDTEREKESPNNPFILL